MADALSRMPTGEDDRTPLDDDMSMFHIRSGDNEDDAVLYADLHNGYNEDDSVLYEDQHHGDKEDDAVRYVDNIHNGYKEDEAVLYADLHNGDNEDDAVLYEDQHHGDKEDDAVRYVDNINNGYKEDEAVLYADRHNGDNEDDAVLYEDRHYGYNEDEAVRYEDNHEEQYNGYEGDGEYCASRLGTCIIPIDDAGERKVRFAHETVVWGHPNDVEESRTRTVVPIARNDTLANEYPTHPGRSSTDNEDVPGINPALIRRYDLDSGTILCTGSDQAALPGLPSVLLVEEKLSQATPVTTEELLKGQRDDA